MISSYHRPTRALIDLEAIANNVKSVQEHIPSDKKTFAVVKANAYGHGAVEVSKYIESIVDGFCVSNLDEAIELRQAGIVKMILVLGVVMPEQVILAKNENITLTVASLEWLRLCQTSAVDLSGLEVHIKVDSGMGRIGVRQLDEGNKLISELGESGASVKGIFTHFATADEADNCKFNQQLTFFKDFISGLYNCPDLVHASNSATSLWHSETIFNAVRLGVVMYGLNPSGTDLDLPYPINPALSLESELVHVKQLHDGSQVGYGATYQVTGDEFVGTVPIGYADGWTRDMQGFSVIVNGELCEIIGRVSMDQMTIRLPQKYTIGTKVTLIGQQGSCNITTTDVAQKRQTINYEVLCLLSDRIPRYY